jgi:sulfite exporter TauE/SafE/copper chaperone CopZ
MDETKEHMYYVQGIHCASCELLIEKRLLELKGVKSVEASVKNGRVLVESEDEVPKISELNRMFEKENYIFSENKLKGKNAKISKNKIFSSIILAIFLITIFIVFDKSGISKLVRVDSKSSLPTFFVFGLVAGISSCAALIGGMILSLSKQWESHKFQPHFLFNLGRVISYAVFGAVLGMIGSSLKFSLTFSSLLVVVVSVIMFFLGLQMLGVKALQKFQITAPKFITRRIANESNFKGKYMPFLMGVFTFFLPCGFTITAQGLALLSGNALQGGLIMLSFALGTLPMLFFISFSSIKFLQKPHFSSQFLKVAGILVLFFALFNFNSQLNVLGVSSLNNINLKEIFSANKNPENNQIKDLPPIIDGKQIIKMEASTSGYKPNYFKIRVNVPVKWEITDTGTSGCTNAVVSRGLFNDAINLVPGQTSIKEFTPAKTGKYKFSCWMGMITGVIEVVGGV